MSCSTCRARLRTQKYVHCGIDLSGGELTVSYSSLLLLLCGSLAALDPQGVSPARPHVPSR